MKQFLFNIFLFLVTFFSVAYLLQLAIDKGLQKQQDNTYKDWNLIFNGEVNSDIIILGSSRAWSHFNPKIIEDSTKMSCYNLGIDGGMTVMQMTKWRSFINYNKPPKILILSIDAWSIGKRANIFVKEQFFPYLYKNEIYNYLKLIDNKLYYDRYIPLYKYHGYVSLCAKGLASFCCNKIDMTYPKYKGFAHKKDKWNMDFEKYKNSLVNKEIIFDSKKIKLGMSLIDTILKDCNKNNIHLILVHSPNYHKLTDISPQHDSILSVFNNFAITNNCTFWDFSKDSLSYSSNFFADHLHLNDIGSNIFTTKVAKKLQVFVKEKF